MKKIIVIVALLFTSAAGFCASQPHNLGYVSTDNPLGLYAQTLAQVNALTPDTTNQLIVCSDCKFALCISTGAQSLARGGYVVIGSTIPAASSGNAQPLHCQ